MTEQIAITLIAASVGLVSAVLFCIGNVSNSPKKILNQATPRWDFSEPVASALAEQRAQYIVGALLLLSSFALQVMAVLASSTSANWLPTILQHWLALVIATLLPMGLIAFVSVKYLHRSAMKRILVLEEEQQHEVQAEIERQNQQRAGV